MKSSPWKALCSALVVALLGSTASGQPAKPGAAPTALPAGHPPTGNMPPGHPPTGDAPAPTGDLPPGHPPMGAAPPGGSMPPGHPPTGDAPGGGSMPPGHPPTGDLPPGHPPTGDDDDGGGSSAGQPNPHGGSTGSAANAGRMQIFDAPPDTAEDDANLPPGTLILTLKDAQEKPIPNIAVTLGILHNTVATGESSEKKAGTADGEGTLRWDNLPVGSGTSYRATVTRGPGQFGTDPFSLGDRAGKRVVLHVYEVTEDPEQAVVLAKVFASVSLGEDSLVVVQRYDIFNLTPIAWVPKDVGVTLPEGYKAFNRPDAMDGVGVDEVNGRGLLRGTITPGVHSVSFRFQVPLGDDEKQILRLETPVRVVRAQVIAEAGKTTGLSVRGEPRPEDAANGGKDSIDFPSARKTKNREGKRVLVSEFAMTRDDGTLKAMEITLTGLPTEGPGRWFALALGIFAVIAGALYVQKRYGQKEADEETRADLLDAREALLREVVELERAHRAGEIGPKTYQRLRNALLDALDRLMTKIADATPKKPSRDAGRPLSVADADAEE